MTEATICFVYFNEVDITQPDWDVSLLICVFSLLWDASRNAVMRLHLAKFLMPENVWLNPSLFCWNDMLSIVEWKQFQ